MQDFNKKKILLGLCGSIATYKSAYLVRELTSLGATVKVIMTEAAEKFISPLTMQALSGNEVRTSLFDERAEQAMGHIELARWADYFLIAPASANCLAKLAQGLADDLLTTLYLVAEMPVIICPAMNRAMWHHPATVNNCTILTERGVFIVGPQEGLQACGDEGYGRFSNIDEIITALRLVAVKKLLVNKKVLITAGPTIEPIDPVRYISNHSSGKMGYSLAAAARMAGAEVILISGPTSLEKPTGVTVHMVDTAKMMAKMVLENLEEGIIFIATAAVADYAVETVAQEKIKKQQQEQLTLNLIKNPDILTTVAMSGKASFVVGFAAETNNLIEQAKKKLITKKLDMIVANEVGPTLGFNNDCNQVTIITAKKEFSLPLMHKTSLAAEIIMILAEIIKL